MMYLLRVDPVTDRSSRAERPPCVACREVVSTFRARAAAMTSRELVAFRACGRRRVGSTLADTGRAGAGGRTRFRGMAAAGAGKMLKPWWWSGTYNLLKLLLVAKIAADHRSNGTSSGQRVGYVEFRRNPSTNKFAVCGES